MVESFFFHVVGIGVLRQFRNRAGLLARVNLALFALVWISAVAAPCAMAMHVEPADSGALECPHCPPRPCHEFAPDDCDLPDLESLIAVEKTLSTALIVAPIHAAAVFPPATTRTMPATRGNAPRAGPRAHLLHVQFNE